MNSDVKELHDLARQVVTDAGIAADEDATWTLIAELGWLMVATPEDLGGLGMGLSGACALHRELGRGLATVPFLPAMLAIDAISQGELADRESWLERLTTGEAYVAASLSESSFTFSQNAGGGCRLSGSASAVFSADRASHVLACATDGSAIALVDLQQPGVDVVSRPTWDETRRLFDIQVADVQLDPGVVIARGDRAEGIARRLAVLRDFALSADAVGGAGALLEATVEYLQTRRQFGRPLALFQALKHRCADLKALTEAADALLVDSLDRVGELTCDSESLAGAEMMGRAAKQLACTAYMTVAEEALQLHGGIGMTAEHECHLFLKRAMLNEHLGGQQACYDVGVADYFLGGS